MCIRILDQAMDQRWWQGKRKTLWVAIFSTENREAVSGDPDGWQLQEKLSEKKTTATYYFAMDKSTKGLKVSTPCETQLQPNDNGSIMYMYIAAR